MNKVLTDILKKRQKKEKHHFVPQVYIKKFYDESIEKVWRGCITYKKVRAFSSAQIFYVPKLYDIKLFKQEFYEIEDFFGSLETEIGLIYKRFDNIEAFKSIGNNKIEKDNIFFFLKIIILSQYFRTKDLEPNSFKEYCTNLVSIYNEKEVYLKKEFPFIKREELREFEKVIKRGMRKEKKYVNEIIKSLQYTILPVLLSDLSKKGIKIVKHSTKKYISSDKPVVCGKLDNILNFKNFLYPLTPNILIYSLGDDITEELIKDDEKVNDCIFENSISYIISHDKAKVEHYINH